GGQLSNFSDAPFAYQPPRTRNGPLCPFRYLGLCDLGIQWRTTASMSPRLPMLCWRSGSATAGIASRSLVRPPPDSDPPRLEPLPPVIPGTAAQGTPHGHVGG